MNKKAFISMMLALVSMTMTGLAQEIKMNETAISDYIPLLNAKGYQAYSFDVSAIKGRNVEIYCREFVNRKEVEDSPRLLFPYYLLKLKQIYWESENKYIYSYRSDPFEPTSPLEKETFIPLVYYSSFWYDAEDKVTRCCGSIADIIKRSPHYYIMGIKFY